MLNTKAPDFSLEATSGEKIRLDSLHGSFVVLIFYPANDTPTCNAQLQEISVTTQDLLSRNTLIYGVNTAPLARSSDYCVRKKLAFPILSDQGGQVAKLYKAFWPWLSLNRRTVVVVDPHGEIVFYERGKPPAERILSCIDERRSVKS